MFEGSFENRGVKAGIIGSLNEMALFLVETLEVDEVVRRAVERTVELLGAYGGGMYLLREDGATLELIYTSHRIVPFGETSMRVDEGLSGEAFREGRAVSTGVSDYPLVRLKKYFLAAGIKTAAAVPLYSKGKVLGSMGFASQRGEVLSRDELDFLDSIASVVSSAMEKALLFQQLGKAKAEWETTFDSITDLITIHDLDYTVVRANRAVFELLGLPPGEVIGRKCYELFHPGGDRPLHTCPVAKFLRNADGRPFYSGESVIRGQDFKVSVFPLRDDEGELTGVVQVASNVSEEKRLMEAAEFRARSASVLNELTKAINCSLELEIITVNLIEGLKKIFKVDRIGLGRFIEEEEAFGFKVYQDRSGRLKMGKEYVIKIEESPDLKRAWDERAAFYCRELKASSEPLGRLLYGEGLGSHLAVPVVADEETIASVNLCDRAEGRFSGQEIAFLEDVANHLSLAMKNARLYKRLERAHEELKSMHLQVLQAEKLSSMGKLSAGTAHEILNPLNIISMQAQIMDMDWDLNKDQQKAVGSILNQVERIKKIADGLRAFSRQYKLKGEVRVDVNGLMDESLNLIAHDLKVNNIAVKQILAAGLPMILADKDQLMQVFLNIMMNSRDAMPQGGTLTITSGLWERGKKKGIDLEFSDTGTGIPPEVLPNIFDPFFTTKPEDKGTGLGLSICYGIVERMGGKIGVQSVVGEGSRFVVSLPV